MDGIVLAVALVMGVAIVAAGLHIAGGADGLAARPFDDDTNVAGQIARLVLTGSLGDAIGYPRAFQLGGNVVLGALAPSPWVAFAIDRIALVLTLALIATQIDVRQRTSAVWLAILALVAWAAGTGTADASPYWTAALLLVTLYMTTSTSTTTAVATGRAVAVVVTAALVLLRFELAPAAIVGLVSWWRARDAGDARRWRNLAVAGAAAAALVMPLVIVRELAMSSLDANAISALAAKLPPLPVRLALFVLVLAPAALLVRALAMIVAASPSAAWPAYATAAAIAGIVSQLAGDRPYATRFIGPLVIALAIVAFIPLVQRAAATVSESPARSRLPVAIAPTVALVAAMLAVLLVHEGGTERGRSRWSARIGEHAAVVEYLRHVPAPPPSPSADHAALLARVPPGSTVAVWVAHPERLDHSRHHIVDLRTPRVAAHREHTALTTRSGSRRGLAALLQHTRYLLVEHEDSYLARTSGNVVHRMLCKTLHPGCADDLEVLALRPAIAEVGNVRLVALQ